MTFRRVLTTAGVALKLTLTSASGLMRALVLAFVPTFVPTLVPIVALTLALSPRLSHGAPAIQVQDDRGRTVTLDAPARRAVTLAPHATELIYAAGAGGYIVGTVL